MIKALSFILDLLLLILLIKKKKEYLKKINTSLLNLNIFK